MIDIRRTGVLRPTQGPHNVPSTSQRPRSKTNKLYYYQGYHDGTNKHKKEPPKGMYINHDDVLKLAAQDLNAKETPRKQPVLSRSNDLLVETDREIGVLHSHVRLSRSSTDDTISLTIIFLLSFSSMFSITTSNSSSFVKFNQFLFIMSNAKCQKSDSNKQAKD